VDIVAERLLTNDGRCVLHDEYCIQNSETCLARPQQILKDEENRHAEGNSALGVACVGLIDTRAQPGVLSARRTDTPPAADVSGAIAA
jgi:hypothetical protein